VAIEVDDQLALEEDHAVGRRRRVVGDARAAQDIPEAGHEDPRAERLGHVVVCAEFDAGDDIGLLALRGDHHDRDGAGVLALLELAADLESIEVGQHQIEDDQVRLLTLHDIDGDAAAVHLACAHARALGVELDEFRDLGLVLDDQDLCLRIRHAGKIGLPRRVL